MSAFRAKEGFDLYYYGNIYYGRSEYASKLANDNGISLDADIAGLDLYYDENFIGETPNDLSPTNNESVLKTENTSLSNQNIFDLALQLYGSIEYAYKIVQGSTMSNINDRISRVTSFDPSLFVDELLKKTLSLKNIIFATETIETVQDLDCGIGSWIIGDTFVVGGNCDGSVSYEGIGFMAINNDFIIT